MTHEFLCPNCKVRTHYKEGKLKTTAKKCDDGVGKKLVLKCPICKRENFLDYRGPFKMVAGTAPVGGEKEESA